jgi:transcriptional regulator with XRE-family HTH domain
MLLVVDNTRRQQLAWLKAIREETGWNWSELARRATLTPQLFSKFRNDPENKAVLDTRTVSKIAAISPVPHYENKRARLPEGFDEGEASAYAEADTDPSSTWPWRPCATVTATASSPGCCAPARSKTPATGRATC